MTWNSGTQQPEQYSDDPVLSAMAAEAAGFLCRLGDTVEALDHAEVRRCTLWDECGRYRELADLLGHHRQGHLILRTVTREGITTRARLAAANLHDIRYLGPDRIALIRRRLTETAESAGPR